MIVPQPYPVRRYICPNAPRPCFCTGACYGAVQTFGVYVPPPDPPDAWERRKRRFEDILLALRPEDV